jgi:hypothetical protein
MRELVGRRNQALCGRGRDRAWSLTEWRDRLRLFGMARTEWELEPFGLGVVARTSRDEQEADGSSHHDQLQCRISAGAVTERLADPAE